MTTQFVPGKVYFGRSICDSEAITTMRVISRTRCTITVALGTPNGGLANERTKTLRPYLYRDVEHVRPNGNYSMALTIGADRQMVPAAGTLVPVVRSASSPYSGKFAENVAELPRSESAVRRAIRAYASGANLDETIEAVTLEGDTVTVERLILEEVTL